MVRSAAGFCRCVRISIRVWPGHWNVRDLGERRLALSEPLGAVVAFTAGLFSFLSPCVLPLFPSYLSFVTGMSVSDLSADLTSVARRRVVLHAVAFIMGFSVIFVALGASFSAAGAFLLDHREWIRRIGGLLIIVFGLYIVGLLRIGVLGRTQQIQLRQKPVGYVGSFIVGLTFAIGWTPCVGPILGAILSLAGTADTVQRGIGLLAAYSAGLGVPFLLSAVALGMFLKFLKRYRPLIPLVERFAGVMLVVVGLLVLTNYYLILNFWAIALTPDWLLRRL
jgi:cytochrome c-type biogenesis protein